VVNNVKGLLQINEDNAIKKTFINNKAVRVPCSERSLTLALNPNKKNQLSFVAPMHIL